MTRKEEFLKIAREHKAYAGYYIDESNFEKLAQALADSEEARLKPLREVMEFKKNNPNKVGTYLKMIDAAIKQVIGGVL